MAPRRLYPAPHVQLRALLLEAKADGLEFDDAWDRAVRPGKGVVMTNSPDPPAGAIRWPTDNADRGAWRDSILETREGWRSAYEGWAQTEAERAVVRIRESISVLGNGINHGAPVASLA